MNFRIADTFTDSLARLTGDEQKAVKTTAFDLQINPASPGLSFHKLHKARDRNFWSVRVGSDIRLIVHRTDASLFLCYVDHHDKAYQWAERRRLETHPKTGAAQLVEVRETVQEVIVPVYVHEERKAPPKAVAVLSWTLSPDGRRCSLSGWQLVARLYGLLRPPVYHSRAAPTTYYMGRLIGGPLGGLPYFLGGNYGPSGGVH